VDIYTEFDQNPSGNVEGPQLIMAFTEPISTKLVHTGQRFFKKSYTEIHEHVANVLANVKSHASEQTHRGAKVVCI
jgi:hypothetical protein